MKAWIAKALGIGRTLLGWLWDIARGPVGDAIERMLPIALEIVTELAVRRDLTSAQKRDKAGEMLTAAAQREMVHVSTSMVNLIVEMAVNQLRTR
jgi:hypothetical protein